MNRSKILTGLRAVAAFVVIGALSLLALEGLVRLFRPQEEPSLWLTPDVRYGHRMKADYHQRVMFAGGDVAMDVDTNSLGFRDEEPAALSPGMKTIVFAGDSFTFGHGVQVVQRFDTLAKDALKAAGKNVRCINLGVSAWGTLQQTRFLRDHLSQLQPDFVVLTFCENDPHDDEYFLAHGISFDRVRFPGKELLRSYSHLFRFIQSIYLTWRKTSQYGQLSAEPDAASKRAALAQRAQHEQAPIQAFAPPISERQWTATEQLFREFMKDFRTTKPEGMLLLQTTDPVNEDICAHLERFAQEIPGVKFVDWREAAGALSLSERRLPYDGHWSLRMHQLSAKALTEALLRFLPTS